jgi:hypothetical protein
MPIQVHGVLVPAISDFGLSRVRTEPVATVTAINGVEVE